MDEFVILTYKYIIPYSIRGCQELFLYHSFRATYTGSNNQQPHPIKYRATYAATKADIIELTKNSNIVGNKRGGGVSP
jgi:hypothetical protein